MCPCLLITSLGTLFHDSENIIHPEMLIRMIIYDVAALVPFTLYDKDVATNLTTSRLEIRAN